MFVGPMIRILVNEENVMCRIILSLCVSVLTISIADAARWTDRASYYRAGGLTAAHRTLPVGTHVHVTNLRNGKSVVVIVRGRGPFIRGRIIDVSTSAASALGFTRAGTTMVRIETQN